MQTSRKPSARVSEALITESIPPTDPSRKPENDEENSGFSWNSLEKPWQNTGNIAENPATLPGIRAKNGKGPSLPNLDYRARLKQIGSMIKPDTNFHASLSAITGAKHVHDRAALSGRDPGFHPDNLAADIAVYPATTDELSEVVTLCAQHAIPIVPHGGLTGLSGAAASTQGSVIIGLRRMATVERLDPLAGTATVQAGASLQSVEEAASEHCLSVGVDLGARGTATIGGMISTNAGGMEAFRNGSMRARVLGIEAVTASGAILNDLSEVPKCNEGYDLKHLFCGAEGTLGIVTRAVLRLTPATTAKTTILIAVENAAAALSLMNTCRTDLLHAELMWHKYAATVAAEIGLSHVLPFRDAPAYLLLELSAEQDALDTLFGHPAILDAIIPKNERERADIWRIREESFIVDNTVPHCQWFDISVPHSRIDETVAGIETRLKALDPDIGIWLMGHLGDGNLHYTIGNGQPMDAARKTAIADAVYSGLKSIGGSFSAEHGIGTEKRASLAKHSDPEKLRLMHAIKTAFDPQGIMNPGKVL